MKCEVGSNLIDKLSIGRYVAEVLIHNGLRFFVGCAKYREKPFIFKRWLAIMLLNCGPMQSWCVLL